MYVYDSRRIFWPANAPAKSIPIDIDSPGEISSATNVQQAIQMLTDDISATIGKLPKEIEPKDATLRDVASKLNLVIQALKCLRTENKGNQ